MIWRGMPGGCWRCATVTAASWQAPRRENCISQHVGRNKRSAFRHVPHSGAIRCAIAPCGLLGVPGDNTFANYAEANRVFFQTVLPLAQRVGASIAQWLGPQFGDSIRVTIDTDRIDALAADRAALWDRVINAAFLQ